MTKNEYPNYRRDWRDRLWFLIGPWRNFVARVRVRRGQFRRWLTKERPIRWVLTEKRHKRIVAQIDQRERAHYHWQQQRHEQEIKELTADLRRVLPKLILCTMERRDPPYQDFRLAIHLNERFIHEALAHGGDERMIRHIGEDVGRQVEHLIRGANFLRQRVGGG